jgi:hypothetical protein
MGEIADQLIDDFIFGEPEVYRNVYYKRTEAEKRIAAIRKEIALEVKSGTSLNDARRNANIKYGKGWREQQ